MTLRVIRHKEPFADRLIERAPSGDRARSVHNWHLTPYLFLLPGIVFFAVWVYAPLIQTFWLSLFRGSLVRGVRGAAGLQNYVAVLTLPEFHQSLVNTVLYILGLIILAVIFPFFVALLLERVGKRLRATYNSVLFTPVIMAPAVVSLIWLWILNPIQGILNQVLSHLFGWAPLNWLGSNSTALWVVIFITAWKVFGFSLLIFLAALVGIDREYIHAARIDGASEWQIVRYITLPLLSPTFSFLLLYTILFAGQWAFGPIDILTQGGPDNTTTNIYYSLYQFGFVFFDTGQAAATAIMLFLVLGIGTFVGILLIDRKAHFES